MTDKLVIKALECCTKKYGCRDCPLGHDDLCMITINKEALNLIKRQRAEIKVLTEANKELKHEMSYMSNSYTIGDRYEMGG